MSGAWRLTSTPVRAGALALVLATCALLLWEWRPDSRPDGNADQIRALASRSDLNVLFFLIDTLRADHLGVYGYQRDTSPGLDALANTGVRFARNRAQSSWTKASMASLWTGLYPVRTGVRRYEDALSQAARVPAEILSEAGWLTGAIWRNDWIAPIFHFDQGFDVYQKPHADSQAPQLRGTLRAGRVEGTDADLVASAIEFLRTHFDRRWFLYLHMMDVHQYTSSEDMARFGASQRDDYDHAVRWTDHQVQQIVDELEALALRDRTLIIIASDHGEAFGEHGREGHAKELYAETTHTPVILSLPFRLETGIVVDAPTQNVDLWPTLLDLLGLPGLGETDGESRLPEIFGDPAAVGAAVDYAEQNRHWGQPGAEPSWQVAVRKARHRIVQDATLGVGAESPIFDLAADPREREPVPVSAARRAELEGLIRDYLALAVAWEDARVPQVDPDATNLGLLRALGYGIE